MDKPDEGADVAGREKSDSGRIGSAQAELLMRDRDAGEWGRTSYEGIKVGWFRSPGGKWGAK